MKNIYKLLAFFTILGAAYYVWYVHFNFRFEEISKGKVYRSALIPPDKLESYLIKNKIKTVVDLLDPGVQDALNPAQLKDIIAEDDAIKAINKKNNLNIRHINIPSGQVPNKKNLINFYKVLDDPTSYPILIHCYHGTGRAAMYSALYRIEHDNHTNEEARQKTRFMVQGFGYKSSFSDGREKGKFLINYKKRDTGKNATLNTMK
ncbi:MAG: protein phosphatase [Helicobacteraceae bacterium]|nr:protein phosphatase [Helicobacteraceae bacterium]